MLYPELIQTLKARRLALQVTQETLAELAGVGLRTLKEFESGLLTLEVYSYRLEVQNIT